MKVLSLFDGISCGMVALERAGIQIEKYVAYEIEENAIKVSQHNYPMIEQKGDVFEAVYQEGEFDILLGGSPCTYWSIARCPNTENKRETVSSGLGWELFMQYVRALHEAKPKWFLYENNESMADAIKEEITRQLGVEPVMIDSADFSAQKRKRYYWTNIPLVLNYEPSQQMFADIQYNGEHKIKSFEIYKDSLRVSADGKCYSWDTSGKGNYSQQNRARTTDQKLNTLPSSGDDKNNIYLGGYSFRKIHPIEAERMQTLPDNYTSCLKSGTKRIEVCGNGWTVDVIAHILTYLPLVAEATDFSDAPEEIKEEIMKNAEKLEQRTAEETPAETTEATNEAPAAFNAIEQLKALAEERKVLAHINTNTPRFENDVRAIEYAVNVLEAVGL